MTYCCFVRICAIIVLIITFIYNNKTILCNLDFKLSPCVECRVVFFRYTSELLVATFQNLLAVPSS